MTEIKYRTCNLCEALCGLAIEVSGQEVISIKGDQLDIFSKGHICPKAVALKDIHEDPDRLRHPIEKINGQWKRIAWEEAIEKAAKGLYEVQQKYKDKNVIAVYQGNPSVHNLGTSLFSPDWVRTLETVNRYSATSVDQLAHHLAAEYMFGHQFLVPIPDIKRTKYWLIIGGNPLVSNGSLMTAPNVSGELKQIQQRGGKVVVIDPRRTETAVKADEHHFIKPGTDIWLLLAMIQEVLVHDSVRLRQMKALIDPKMLIKIKTALSRFDTANASRLTGISVETIKAITNDFIAADAAVCYGRLGVSASRHGALCHWAINTLNVLTGNFDRPGGAMLTSPAIDLASGPSKTKRFRRWHSRVRKLPEFGGELPSSTLAEDILVNGEGQIRGLFTSCGNPVLSVPNGRKLDQALGSLDFMVAVDIYLNETTRHANIILPPATGLETPHYGIAFHNLAIHNSAKYSEAVMSKGEDTMYDWEIFQALCSSYRSLGNPDTPVIPISTIAQRLDGLLMRGNSGLSFEDLKTHPHGIDLGPLQSTAASRICTSDGMIDLFPTIYQEALASLLEEGVTMQGMLLIGRRHLRSNNSWMHNSYRLVKGRPRCTLLIHPSDAKARQITQGETVIVKTAVGEELIDAEITDEIMPGVVSIPHGWGHNRSGTAMKIAETHAGISLNDLLDDQEVDNLSGVSVINGIEVDVYKIKPES